MWHKEARPFTPNEDAEILRGRDAKESYTEIGCRLGRGYESVRRRYEILMAHRLTVRTAARHRLCLHCRKSFLSDGPHNRLCLNCQRHADDHDHPMASL